MSALREKLTYANVVSTICLFLLLGGAGAYAASQLGKNSVGAKQLRKNAVTTAKVKNQAITAAKIKNGTITGQQVNVATLGTVPSAQTAKTADVAESAKTVQSLPPAEAWHEVGADGQPAFLNGWANLPSANGRQTVAYYRDQTGVVHLRGVAKKTGGGGAIFDLPPGFRPNASIQFVAACGECGVTELTRVEVEGPTGSVGGGGGIINLTGMTYRAEG